MLLCTKTDSRLAGVRWRDVAVKVFAGAVGYWLRSLVLVVPSRVAGIPQDTRDDLRRKASLPEKARMSRLLGGIGGWPVELATPDLGRPIEFGFFQCL